MNPEQHSAEYSVGLFIAALRGQGLGREITRLVLAWAFDVLGVHRVELQVLASNSRAINCYLACGFRREGVRREAELYPGRLERLHHDGRLALRARCPSLDSRPGGFCRLSYRIADGFTVLRRKRCDLHERLCEPRFRHALGMIFARGRI